MHAFVTHNCLLFTVNVLLNLSIDTNLFLEKLPMTGQKKVPYSVLPTMTRFATDGPYKTKQLIDHFTVV